MDITLYSNDCPRCRILRTKLDQKNIQYNVFSDTDKMIEMGMKIMPILFVNGEFLDFSNANKWINDYNFEG